MQEQTNKIGHLNMIQGIISRMGNNAFSLKQWAVGIMIAIYAFAGENSHKAVIVTIIPLIVFWFLDSYYLMIERKYRCLYDEVRRKKEKRTRKPRQTSGRKERIKSGRRKRRRKTGSCWELRRRRSARNLSRWRKN